MSELSKLIGKSKIIKLGEAELKMVPLTANDMDLMHSFGDAKGAEQVEIIKKIIVKSVPGSTLEEVNNMSVEYMIKLQDEIMEINNLNPDKDKKSFEDGIKEKQNLPKK